jgi:hypothetical protein
MKFRPPIVEQQPKSGSRLKITPKHCAAALKMPKALPIDTAHSCYASSLLSTTHGQKPCCADPCPMSAQPRNSRCVTVPFTWRCAPSTQTPTRTAGNPRCVDTQTSPHSCAPTQTKPAHPCAVGNSRRASTRHPRPPDAHPTRGSHRSTRMKIFRHSIIPAALFPPARRHSPASMYVPIYPLSPATPCRKRA